MSSSNKPEFNLEKSNESSTLEDKKTFEKNNEAKDLNDRPVINISINNTASNSQEISERYGAYRGMPGISEKSKAVALILLFVLPTFHRVYAGRIITAILFLITLGGFGIWWIIDFFIIITGGLRDSYGNFIKNW